MAPVGARSGRRADFQRTWNALGFSKGERGLEVLKGEIYRLSG